MKQLQKKIKSGTLDLKKDDPFELFVSATNIRYCYYAETHKILGNTYGMCVLQVKNLNFALLYSKFLLPNWSTLPKLLGFCWNITAYSISPGWDGSPCQMLLILFFKFPYSLPVPSFTHLISKGSMIHFLYVLFSYALLLWLMVSLASAPMYMYMCMTAHTY